MKIHWKLNKMDRVHEIQKLHTILTQKLQNLEDGNLTLDTPRLEDLPAAKISKSKVLSKIEWVEIQPSEVAN